jgi:hypothetical protein
MKLYLIPAYQDTIRNQGYGYLIKKAEKAGYAVEILNLQIQNRRFNEVVQEGIQTICRDKIETKAILGFSTGALISYQITTKIKFEKAFFCSMSPLLETDIPKSDKIYVKYFGKKTVEDLKKQKYGISKAKTPLFFVGNKEGRKLIGRTKNLVEKCAGELIIIKNNDHELDTNYIKEISLKL